MTTGIVVVTPASVRYTAPSYRPGAVPAGTVAVTVTGADPPAAGMFREPADSVSQVQSVFW